MGVRSAVSQKLAHAADLQVQAMLSAARCVITTLDSPLILHRPLAASSARGDHGAGLQYAAH